MDKITTVGLDLAKSVFSVHGVDGQGRTVLRRTVRRDKLMELVAALPPCLIGMEACGGAHEWHAVPNLQVFEEAADEVIRWSNFPESLPHSRVPP